MAGITNTGIVNYVSNAVNRFPKWAITVDIFGNVFLRDYEFGAGDDTGVYWSDENYSRKVLLFLSAAMRKSLDGKFSYGKKLRSSESLNLKMALPIKNEEIDFDCMEGIIAEVESMNIRELEAANRNQREAYFAVAGLDDMGLTETERAAVSSQDQIIWKEFNLLELFGPSTRGRRLKSDDWIPGTLPFVTAGEKNTGISSFIDNDVEVFAGNTVTIDMFGSAKYRDYEYGADDHIAVVHTEHLPKFAAIFVTAAIHKSSYNGKFNYGKNFYAKDGNELTIWLPCRNGEPDHEYMSAVVSAIQKEHIRDAVYYSEQYLAEYKSLCD